MINEDSVIVFDSEMKEKHRTKGFGKIKIAKREYNGFLIAYGPK